MTQDRSARPWMALALIVSGSLLIGGSNIYGVLYLPRSEVAFAVWPIWVLALAPITAGVLLLRRNNAKAK